jgi:hypothetical protein
VPAPIVSIGLLFDLFFIPSQVRIANNKLMGQGDPGSTSVSNQVGNSEPNYEAVDAAIARYKEQATTQSAAAPAPAHAAKAPAGFGRRGLTF